MKKLFTLLLVTTLFISCSSDDSDNHVEPDIENNDKEIDQAISKDINLILPILNFGVQENELHQIISDNNYSETSYPFTGDEYMYGAYDTYGSNNLQMIVPYGFAVKSIKINDKDSKPVADGRITHVYLFENNDDADAYPGSDNEPYYQVQIFYNGTENTYDMVKEWVLSLKEITSEFKPVTNLKNTKEKIVEKDFTVEVGYFKDSLSDGTITFARFYDNRIPVYAN